LFTDVNDYTEELSGDLNDDSSIRFSNNLNVRASVRNAVVSYNAIQKVFRTRFDENRSNAKLADFSNAFLKQPFISSDRTPYEKLLGKTKEDFFRNNFYKNNFKPTLNNLYEIQSGLNFYFYDFPFLLALKSDASRYLWFD